MCMCVHVTSSSFQFKNSALCIRMNPLGCLQFRQSALSFFLEIYTSSNHLYKMSLLFFSLCADTRELSPIVIIVSSSSSFICLYLSLIHLSPIQYMQSTLIWWYKTIDVCVTTWTHAKNWFFNRCMTSSFVRTKYIHQLHNSFKVKCGYAK